MLLDAAQLIFHNMPDVAHSGLIARHGIAQELAMK